MLHLPLMKRDPLPPLFPLTRVPPLPLNPPLRGWGRKGKGGNLIQKFCPRAGEFVQGRKHGQGVVQLAEGLQYKASFQNGRRISR